MEAAAIRATARDAQESRGTLGGAAAGRQGGADDAAKVQDACRGPIIRLTAEALLAPIAIAARAAPLAPGTAVGVVAGTDAGAMLAALPFRTAATGTERALLRLTALSLARLLGCDLLRGAQR